MKKILLIVLAFFAFAEGFSQTQLWSKTSEGKLNILEKTERASFPSEYQLYHLDFSALKSQLAAAPSRSSKQASDVVISFPNAEGRLERFRIYEASVLEAPLAKKHQEIQSYVGKGIDDPTATIRFSTTIFGLHTMTLSGKGTYYIDPYTKDLQNYIVYNRSSLGTTRNFQCHFDDTDHPEEGIENRLLATDGIFRTYRLAMACTVEYAAFHIQRASLPPTATLAEKKAAVLAAMGVTMTRVNGLYETDMSLTMVIVATNENIIFVDSDNFTNSPEMLNEIQPIVDAAIGTTNYDIGHGVCTTDSGIAQLQSPCGTSKARGITGQISPVGDTFDIDYVAHEMGHQFGATHTQNNDCNRTASTAVEPGSASTIMGYAGICAPNVQSNSDAYFHAVSLNQMFNFVRGNGICSVNVPNGNTAPVIDELPTTFVVPAGTPFVLRGGATDADANDNLTYCWEQTNPGATTATPSATVTTSLPNFRSFSPTTSPNRYFPSLATISSGIPSTWEVLPTVGKNMNFALTVRDNRNPNGGQTARRNITVVFNASGTPFTVTSQSGASSRNTNETDVVSEGWLAGESKTITWNVGTTNVAPINVTNVNILLSTDGGQTFNMLLENTPNDGSQDITVPNVAPSLNCRIMVEAVGNSFFAINRSPFAIGYIITRTCESFVFNTPFSIPNPGTGYTVKEINVPTSGIVSDVNFTANITHTKISDLNIVLLSAANTQINLINGSCATTAATTSFNGTFDDQGSAIVCGTDITGNILPLQPLSTFNGQSQQGNWRVGIRDLVAANAGTVNSYTLTFCTQNAVLSTKTFGLADFKIYPNPNNGNFSIQFNSNSGNEIKVNVHDISGRQIISKSYQNTGMFSENIQMNNIQKGIYIVTVLDGDVKETKKIVIQ